jgi:hypothetical protein
MVVRPGITSRDQCHLSLEPRQRVAADLPGKGRDPKDHRGRRKVNEQVAAVLQDDEAGRIEAVGGRQRGGGFERSRSIRRAPLRRFQVQSTVAISTGVLTPLTDTAWASAPATLPASIIVSVVARIWPAPARAATRAATWTPMPL